MPDNSDPTLCLQFETPSNADPKGWAIAEGQCLKFPEKYLQKCEELNDVVQGLNRVSEEYNQLFGYVVRNLISVVDNCEAGLAELSSRGSIAQESSASTKDDRGEDPSEDEGEESTDETSGDEHACGDENGNTLEGAVSAISPDEPADAETPGEKEANSAADEADDEAGSPAETTLLEKPAASCSSVDDSQPPDPKHSPHEPNVRGESETDETQSAESEIAETVGNLGENDIESGGLASVNRSVLHILEELGAVRIDLLGHTYNDVVVEGQPIEDPFEIVESTQQGKAKEMTVRKVLRDLWVLQRDGTVRVLAKGEVVC